MPFEERFPIKRREALQALGAASLLGNLTGDTECAPPIKTLRGTFSKKRPCPFRVWNQGKTLAPVTQVTPEDGHYVHTYFDVTPFSPSQRYFAVTRVPILSRLPVLGDKADICVIDLEAETIQTVYTTRCWGYQTGSNIQWGSTDRRLYVNDVVDRTAVCVGIDLETTETRAYAGPLYSVAPDESCVVGFPHELKDVSQEGYGVPPKKPGEYASLPPGASKKEGIWLTDLKSNEKRLIASLADVAAKVPSPPPFEGGTYYFWHTKFNRQGTRLLQVLRYMHPRMPDTRNPMMFTFRPDGSDIRFTPKTDRVPVWDANGGHPNWHGDGVHVIRSMPVKGMAGNRFVQARYDGTDFRMLSETIEGGGHPSVEPQGKYLITDKRHHDAGVARMGLRLIDLTANEEMRVCDLPTIDKSKLQNVVFRLDGHPVWSRDYQQVSLQAAPLGKRQLFVVNLAELL
ncbi:MAG: hypothetical protein GY768_27230 [Planctomycetaceae bacterium]|nr:hypothetical protein [Planctomycetaceae bacterium]